MVQMRALIVVEHRAVGLPRPQLPRQLQHIIGVAMLARRLGDMLRGRVGFEEIFAVGIAADHIAVMVNDAVPEERSEEHTSELQSLMRISYAVFCLKKKKKTINKY